MRDLARRAAIAGRFGRRCEDFRVREGVDLIYLSRRF